MGSMPATLKAVSVAEIRERLEAARDDSPFLLYRDSNEGQHIVILGEHACLTIGRQHASDVALPWDGAVSRVHATLERVGEEWTLVDDGSSRNGSFLNGVRMHGRRRLKDGDAIRVGSTTIVYIAPREREVSTSTAAVTGSRVPPITTAQRRVLVSLCRPLVADHFAAASSNQQIARELFLGVETVKTHMQALFEAFGIRHLPQNQKRAELAALALNSGAVMEDELLGGTSRANA
jgi:pSer/pThr/pTyr-binding forkhead associated (FHA) protein